MTWLTPPDEADPHQIAEFIEAELVFAGDDYLSFSELRALHPAGRQWSDEDLTFALAEIEGRDKEGGVNYPYFVVDRGVANDVGERGDIYRFLLLLSLRGTPMRLNLEFQRSDPLFDAVIRETFKAIYGPSSKALVFGWPPQNSGRPTTFPEAVSWAADELGLEMRGGRVPDHKLDAGVDVISWRPFADPRNGFQIVLVQNTVQMRFVKKPRDVDPREWRDWWDVGVEPSVGFAVPFRLPLGDIWWEDITKAANIVLDRGRIVSELTVVNPLEWPEWAAIRKFVAEEVARVRTGGGVVETAVSVPKGRRKVRP